LPIFKVMQEIGNVPDDEMYRTFNMGIGMVLIVKEKDAQNLLRALKAVKLKSTIIGHIEKLPTITSDRLIYS
jgi:phosphoribosylformylglycinamidine cyclo-ligase